LPTLLTILKAEDAHLYTSSMFDWIHMPSGGNIVGWKSLYEAFFDELAWMSSPQKQKYPEEINQSLYAAQKYVKACLNQARSNRKKWDRHIIYRKHAHTVLEEVKDFFEKVTDTEKGATGSRKQL
jgi:hypothetical protein